MINALKFEHFAVVVSKSFNVDVQLFFKRRLFSKKDDIQTQFSLIACIIIRRFWNFNKRLITINIINKSLLLLNLIIKSLLSRERNIFSKKIAIVMNIIQRNLVHDFLIWFKLSYLIQSFLNICSLNTFIASIQLLFITLILNRNNN